MNVTQVSRGSIKLNLPYPCPVTTRCLLVLHNNHWYVTDFMRDYHLYADIKPPKAMEKTLKILICQTNNLFYVLSPSPDLFRGLVGLYLFNYRGMIWTHGRDENVSQRGLEYRHLTGLYWQTVLKFLHGKLNETMICQARGLKQTVLIYRLSPTLSLSYNTQLV